MSHIIMRSESVNLSEIGFGAVVEISQCAQSRRFERSGPKVSIGHRTSAVPYS